MDSELNNRLEKIEGIQTISELNILLEKNF